MRIQQELQKFSEEQRYEVSRLMYGLSQKVRFDAGEDLSKVSADNYGSYISLPGGSIQIPLGFVGRRSIRIHITINYFYFLLILFQVYYLRY